MRPGLSPKFIANSSALFRLAPCRGGISSV
jgi:hypothetical protein